MKRVQACSIYVVVAALLFSNVGAVEKPDAKQATATAPTTMGFGYPTSPGAVPTDQMTEEGAKLIEQTMKLAQEKGYFKKLKTVRKKIEVPSNLEGKSEAEIMNYVNLLYQERRSIQRRFTYHILGTLFGGACTYAFHTNPVILPFVVYIQKQNESYRGTLDADWMVHQEQLAGFLYEYMRVKKINPKSLPMNRMLGSPLISVEYMPEKSINLPVWRLEKDSPLPIEAKIRTTTGLMKNWWFRK